MNKEQVTEMAKAMAINVARNAGVVPEVCFPYIYLGLQDHFKAQAAIAPPVAAGSVDTLQRYELVESQHGTGYMVHWDKAMEEDEDGEWVKHTDAIAWGAQQREAGKQEVSQLILLQQPLTDAAAAWDRIKRAEERAEKAEARVKELERSNLELNRVYEERGRQISRLEREPAAKQAIIDRLMLEYCPDEMSAEQTAEWAKHQVCVPAGIVGSGPNAKEGDRPCWTPDCGTF